jgi:hypothetical protein
MAEKLQRWEKVQDSFQNAVDCLGKELDAGILETVVALNALGFSTTQSCEGHLNWGIAAPWVDIKSNKIDQATIDEATFLLNRAEALDIQLEMASEVTEEMDNEVSLAWEEYHKTSKERHRHVFELQAALQRLLGRFYADRRPEYDVIITLERMGDGFRLQSQGAEVQAIQPDELRAEKLLAYQAEMRAFTEFLKNEYFAVSSNEGEE